MNYSFSVGNGFRQERLFSCCRIPIGCVDWIANIRRVALNVRHTRYRATRDDGNPWQRTEWGKTEKSQVIKLTRLNGDEFVVNAEQIRFVESRPDTFITLTSNDRLIVKETVDEDVQRSVAHSRSLRSLVGAC